MTVIILQDRPADSQIAQALFDTEEAVDHIVELRAGDDTRALFSDMDEESLWRIVGKLQFVLSSIKIDRETVTIEAAE